MIMYKWLDSVFTSSIILHPEIQCVVELAYKRSTIDFLMHVLVDPRFSNLKSMLIVQFVKILVSVA